VDRNGFKTFDGDYWTDEKENIIILLEFETWKLPRIKKHYGPPIWSKEHEKNFWKNNKEKAWLEEDRWVAVVEREYTEVQNLLKTALSWEKIGLLKFGKHIKNNILDRHELMGLNEFLVQNKVKKEVLEFLYLYLNKNWNLWR